MDAVTAMVAWRRMRRYLFGLVIPVALISSQARGGNDHAAHSTRSPFDDEQCERALAFAQTLPPLRKDLVRAEALLCLGINDNHGALLAAERALAQLRERKPTDAFIALEYVDAIRLLYPYADEVLIELNKARFLVAAGLIGEGATEARLWIDDQIQQAVVRRTEFLPRLRSALSRPPGNADELSQLVAELLLSGPDGPRVAVDVARASPDGDWLGRVLQARLNFDQGDYDKACAALAAPKCSHAESSVERLGCDIRDDLKNACIFVSNRACSALSEP